MRTTDAIGPLAPEIHRSCSDGLVWSIDNRFLFGPDVLDGDLTVYNIHGGPLPGYRGLPPATVAYAILNDEREFGATPHRVDPGIDTGPVVAVERFGIDAEDVFEDVMVELVEACHRLFTDNLDAAAAGRQSRSMMHGRAGPSGPVSCRATSGSFIHRWTRPASPVPGRAVRNVHGPVWWSSALPR